MLSIPPGLAEYSIKNYYKEENLAQQYKTKLYLIALALL